MTTVISATELKNKVSKIINEAYFKRETIIVEKHGKPMIKIMPIEEDREKKIKEALDKYCGIMPDFPDVTKFRRSRKRWPKL